MDRKLLIEKYKSKIASTRGRVDVNGNNIEMRLTEDQWCQLWEEAKVIPSRNYVLSRKNDTGHYEIGNVYIQHNLHNVTEALTDNSELEYKITEYAIKTGYKRRTVKAMIKRGELRLWLAWSCSKPADRGFFAVRRRAIMLIYIGFWSAKIPAFAIVSTVARSSWNIAVKRSRPQKCVLFATAQNGWPKITILL